MSLRVSPGSRSGRAAPGCERVDITKANELSIPSDSDFTSTLLILAGVQGNVAYTTLRQANGVHIGIYIAKSWTVEAGATEAPGR